MKTLSLLIMCAALGQVDLADHAMADLGTIPAERHKRIRWFVLDDLAAAERPAAIKVLDGHVNSLSRETDLTRLHVVAGTGNQLLRLNLDDYRWQRAVWEQLADADPYDHVTIEKVFDPALPVPFAAKLSPRPAAGNNRRPRIPATNGQKKGSTRTKGKGQGRATNARPDSGRKGASPAKKKNQQRVLTDRLGKAIGDLAHLTNSQAPIVRATWFFNQTCAAEGRKPNYYDFLGIKNEKDFQELVGFDAKRKRRKVELREAVSDSEVSPATTRAIVRETTEDGGLWKTFDFRKAVDRVNTLRVLGRDIDEEFKKAGVNDAATEQAGPLANGFWAWFLGNNQGARQATAPDFAASDKQSRSNDTRVHANVSCVRCHLPGGLHPIAGYIRGLINPPLALQSPDYKRLRELRQQYLRGLVPFLDKDRSGYAAAVLECTGWEAATYQAAYARFYERYEDAKVDAAWAARSLGVSVKVYQLALVAYLEHTKNLDVVLSAHHPRAKTRQTIGIRQWEEAFPLARQILLGVKP